MSKLSNQIINKKIIQIFIDTKIEFEKLNLDKISKKKFKKNTGKYACMYPAFYYAEEFKKNNNSLKSNLKKIDLYVHIPYCSRICTYCVYSCKTDKSDYKKYLEALIKEIKYYKQFNYELEYLDLGGGTPTELKPLDLKKILDTIKDSFIITKNSILSIELHPEIIHKPNFKEYITILENAKITDICVGVESFDNKILKQMNRGHNSQDSIELIKILRKKFPVIRIDLIYGFKSISFDSWINTIKQALLLDVNDIAAYRFIDSTQTKDKTIDQNNANFMLLLFINIMRAFDWYPGGFMATEFKFINKPKPVRNHKDGLKIIGVGSSAYSITDKYTSANSWDIKEYIKNVNENDVGICLYKEITYRDNLINSIMINLLFGGRLNNKFYKKIMKIDIKKTHTKTLELLIKEKFMIYKKEKETFYVTKKGLLYMDEIVSLFFPKEFYIKYFQLVENKINTKVLLKYQKNILNSPFGFNLNKNNQEIISNNFL